MLLNTKNYIRIIFPVSGFNFFKEVLSLVAMGTILKSFEEIPLVPPTYFKVFLILPSLDASGEGS